MDAKTTVEILATNLFDISKMDEGWLPDIDAIEPDSETLCEIMTVQGHNIILNEGVYFRNSDTKMWVNLSDASTVLDFVLYFRPIRVKTNYEEQTQD